MHYKFLLCFFLFPASIMQGMQLATLIKQEDVFDNHIIPKLDIKSYASLLQTSKIINIESAYPKKIYALFQTNKKEDATKKLNNLCKMMYVPILYHGIQNSNVEFIGWFMKKSETNINSDIIKKCIDYSKKLGLFTISSFLDIYLPKNITTPAFNNRYGSDWCP